MSSLQQSTSCSPCGRSLTREKRAPQSFSLRAFHSTEEVDVDVPRFRLRGELGERSSSDHSCDTVIQLDSYGLVQSKVPPRLTQPEFVPIIPSLHPNKADMDDPEFTALLQELLKIPQLQGGKKKEEVEGNAEGLKAEMKQPVRDCLKCDTFAELQERLGVIDGSETTMDLLKSSPKGGAVGDGTTKSQPSKGTGKQTGGASSDSPQTQFVKVSGCSQSSAGEQQKDAAVPGDSFQREDSGLYDCEECSGTSSSEELLNQALQTNTTKNGTGKSSAKPSPQGVSVDVQDTSVTQSPAPQKTNKQESPEAADWFKPDKRSSPIGKSSPISPSSSCTVVGDVLPNRMAEDVKEMKATITVTVQQPLDLKGQDELVFSMVEEVTISGAVDRGRTGGNIICIRDSAQPQAHAQSAGSSQPIRIISNVTEEPASAGASAGNNNPALQSGAKEVSKEKPRPHVSKEERYLPSFINPMLIHTDVDCELSAVKENQCPHRSTPGVKSSPELRGKTCQEHRKAQEKRCERFISETHAKTPERARDSSFSRSTCDVMVLEESAFGDGAAENKMHRKRMRNTDRNHHQSDREHVYSTHTPRGTEGGEVSSRRDGSGPKGAGVSPGCQETSLAYFKTGSLPRGWQNANLKESYHGNHLADYYRDSRGMTSSTPCSPGVTLERRPSRQPSPVSHSLHLSSPRKHEYKQHAANSSCNKSVESLFESSGLRMKHEHMRLMSPIEDSDMLFSAKLEHMGTRTNSLGRSQRDSPNLDRGGSNTSLSSRGSSKGSAEGGRRGHRGYNNDGDGTFPRSSRSPRKSARSDQTHHAFHSENHVTQSLRHIHSKLSAVGKLKMASPKVRRLSAPSIKNLSLPHKGLRQSVNRSASLSPDGKTVSFERMSSFLSSSPPPSYHSISRTPSQSSTCSSTKSAIQGFVNGRITDLLKERSSSPPSGGLDHAAPLLSPYSRVTEPRMPDHMSGHASDTTSVLSGDLPPAMGKTSLHFSNRNSQVSSGYGSMMRDSEATGSSTSTRDSVSDRSSSLLSVTRSSRSSRRRGNTGKTPARSRR